MFALTTNHSPLSCHVDWSQPIGSLLSPTTHHLNKGVSLQILRDYFCILIDTCKLSSQSYTSHYRENQYHMQIHHRLAVSSCESESSTVILDFGHHEGLIPALSSSVALLSFTKKLVFAGLATKILVKLSEWFVFSKQAVTKTQAGTGAANMNYFS